MVDVTRPGRFDRVSRSICLASSLVLSNVLSPCPTLTSDLFIVPLFSSVSDLLFPRPGSLIFRPRPLASCHSPVVPGLDLSSPSPSRGCLSHCPWILGNQPLSPFSPSPSPSCGVQLNSPSGAHRGEHASDLPCVLIKPNLPKSSSKKESISYLFN